VRPVADRIIYGFFYALGALIFYELWEHDILTASLIWKILTAEI
jgi:hypothetical protein